jgi:superfamily I DNA and/or RNA helicase
MAFLFDRNRFNVAISRAQCLSVLVCCPQLLDARCRNPEQMQLVSLLCGFVERATELLSDDYLNNTAPDSAEPLLLPLALTVPYVDK